MHACRKLTFDQAFRDLRETGTVPLHDQTVAMARKVRFEVNLHRSQTSSAMSTTAGSSERAPFRFGKGLGIGLTVH